MISYYPLLTLLLIGGLRFPGVAVGSDPPPQSSTLAPLPIPSLVQLRSAGDHILFLCRAPEGLRGLRFELHSNPTLLDAVRYPRGEEECGAIFTVHRRDVARDKPFCCIYYDSRDAPSAFSVNVYTKLDEEPSPLPPPSLTSIQQAASSVHIQQGQRLSLRCSVPLCLQPKAFMLLKRSSSTTTAITTGGGVHSALQGPSSLVSSSGKPDFSVAPEASQLYSCLYQMTLSTGQSINSTLSRDLEVTVSQDENTPNTEPEVTQTTDWPLVLGAGSAAALFLVIVIGLAIVIHRRMAELAKEKKKREEDKFWSQVRARDHVIDLPVPRLSSCLKDIGPANADYANPRTLSTFTNQSFC